MSRDDEAPMTKPRHSLIRHWVIPYSFTHYSLLTERSVGWTTARVVRCAGGAAEISRWRKPPDRCPKGAHPGGVLDVCGFPASLPGLTFLFSGVRWLAPPANFRRASGALGRASNGPLSIFPTAHFFRMQSHVESHAATFLRFLTACHPTSRRYFRAPCGGFSS